MPVALYSPKWDIPNGRWGRMCISIYIDRKWAKNSTWRGWWPFILRLGPCKKVGTMRRWNHMTELKMKSLVIGKSGWHEIDSFNGLSLDICKQWNVYIGFLNGDEKRNHIKSKSMTRKKLTTSSHSATRAARQIKTPMSQSNCSPRNLPYPIAPFSHPFLAP